MTLSSATPAAADARAGAGSPWWRFPIVWFAFSGPALVVVAGFATMALAYRHADVVIVELPPATASPGARSGPTTPALAARNHAATLSR